MIYKCLHFCNVIPIQKKEVISHYGDYTTFLIKCNQYFSTNITSTFINHT